MYINGYKLKGELENKNSGFSKWGFATKGGVEYFIKELIEPVYPMDRSVMSDVVFEQRRASCIQYEERFKKYYAAINHASRGNLVRIVEFFRNDSKYYVITEKIDEYSLPIKSIAALSHDKKLLLLKTVAHCFNRLHSAGIVHFDVKPANLLVKKTNTGNYTAKLIDFDAGFFVGEKIDNDELGGDLTYFAPETFLAVAGEDVTPGQKADIFALGLVFHQFYCGELPYFDTAEYEYPYEAALDCGGVVPDKEKMPEDLRKIVEVMLEVDPEKRPTAEEVIKMLNALTPDAGVSRYTGPASEPIHTHSVKPESVTPKSDSPWFNRAGDL